MFSFYPTGHETYSPWSYFEAFSSDECQSIREIVEYTGMLDEHPSYENVELTRIPWKQDYDWIFQRIHANITECNRKFYHFDLDGMNETLERLTYGERGSMVWHIDSTPQDNIATTRKVTCSIQLSESSEYVGGDLELFTGQVETVPKGVGMMAVYPTYIYHRVTEVTEGKRSTLIGHVHGVPFR